MSVITQSIVTSAARCNIRGGVRACESPKSHGGEHSWVGLTHDAAHRYFVNGAGPIPGVTTVTGVLDKPYLVPWAAKVTAEFALEQLATLPALLAGAGDEAVRKMLSTAPKVKRDTAAALGTRIHRLADQVAHGGLTEDITEQELPFVVAYQAWLAKERPEFIATETGIWNERHDYAGTFDMIANLRGATWLVDTKTGSTVDGAMALQLVAYASRLNVLGIPGSAEFAPMPRIQRVGILHVRPQLYPDTGYRFIPYRVDEGTYDAFLAALALYRWREEKSKGVMEVA